MVEQLSSAVDDAMPGSHQEVFTFKFDFIGKPLQQALFVLHDRMRKRINSMYAARRAQESMRRQYQEYLDTKKWPRFVEKAKITDIVKQINAPEVLDPQKRTFQELTMAIDSHDIQQRAELALQAKGAEIEILRQQAALDHLSHIRRI